MEDKTVKNPSDSNQFMLKEYDRIHEFWVSENQQAEQRVSFFLTVASAAVGAVIVLSQLATAPKEILAVAAQGVLIVLLLFGVTTLNRLISRTIQIRVLRRSLASIQDYLARQDAELVTYLETQRKMYRGQKETSKLVNLIYRWLSGTLIDLMILSNSLMRADRSPTVHER